MADDKKGTNKQEGGAGDVLASNPSQVAAPPRTGGQSSVAPVTDERVAQTNLKPLDSLAPSDRAEDEVRAAVDQAMHEQYVQEEAQRRVRSARAQRLMDSVNTQNPYGLKEGEMPVYSVGGWLVDPNGTRIQRAPSGKPGRQETIIDRATSMKEM
jgi:hypothetical protein